MGITFNPALIILQYIFKYINKYKFLIIIIVSTYVIALGDEEGRREYTAISQHTPVFPRMRRRVSESKRAKSLID